MKHIFAVILSILLLTACGESERVQFGRLQQIDSIAEVNADSAIVLLNAINRDSLSSNGNKYYFDLLQIRANDKAYIAHTSDSAILSVINYFENHDFNNLLPIAYYYGGRAYSDLGDAPQALEYFQKALDCPNINPHTQAVAYSQMASIYQEQKVYDLAISAYKKAIELHKINNDTLSYLYNKCSIGEIYSTQNQKDSALITYYQTLKQAKNFGSKKLATSLKLNICDLHLSKKSYNDAAEILYSIRHNLPKEDSTTIANTFAHLYYRLNNNDSTIFYCNKLIKSKNLNVQLNGYNILANLFLTQNNITKATPYIIESQILSDSIRKLNTPQEIRQLSSIYNYQIRERENNKLKQEAQENEFKIIFLVSSIVIIVILALSTILIIRKRKHIIKLKLLNVELLLKQSNDFSENAIAQNNKKIAQLKSQINSINNENQSLIQELENQKKLLELNNEHARLIKAQNESAINTFNNDTFVKEIHNRLQNYSTNTNLISEYEWEVLTQMVCDLFPAFFDTLQNLPFKISIYEFRISILIKTKFTPKEIARLTNHSEPSVSITRIRLYKKLTGNNGHTYDWDNFINNL